MPEAIIRVVASEIRAKAGKTNTIEGYAAKFGVLSRDLGGFVEIIERGAFARAIEEKQDVRFLGPNHDRSNPLARVANGSLRLSEDETGLWFEADIADTTAGRDLLKLIDRRDIDEMSFGFNPKREDWDLGRAVPVRHVRDVDLFDVSTVVGAAYPSTEVARRSNEADAKTAASLMEQQKRSARLARARLSMR